jgi:hypothetical protein
MCASTPGLPCRITSELRSLEGCPTKICIPTVGAGEDGLLEHRVGEHGLAGDRRLEKGPLARGCEQVRSREPCRLSGDLALSYAALDANHRERYRRILFLDGEPPVTPSESGQ